MEELRRSIPRYGGAWRLGRHRVVASYAPHKSGLDDLFSNASLKKTFSIPQHRQECLCYLPEIFKKCQETFSQLTSSIQARPLAG